MLQETLLIGIIFLLLLFYYLQSPFRYWKKRNVPHPPVSYLFGNDGETILSNKHLVHIYQKIYNHYQHLPYVGIYRMRTPCLMVWDPELVKEVLVSSFHSFRESDIYSDEKADPVFSKHIVVSKGKQWKERRSQLAPLLSSKRVKGFHPLMEAVAGRLVEFLNVDAVGYSKAVDAKELSIRYTADVALSCALGLEAHSFERFDTDYIKMVRKMLSSTFSNSLKSWLMINFPSIAKVLRAKFIPDEAVGYWETLVRTTLDYRSKHKIERGDLLDCINEIQAKLGSDIFTDHDITAHILNFFSDVIATSSASLSFTLYELGLNLDIQENLRREILEAKRTCNGSLNYDTIQNIEYLDQVINESLRKNPPFPTLRKMCTERVTLNVPHTDDEPITIDPGTPIIIPVYNIHYDAKYYYEPMLYDPLRFSKKNVEARPKYTFLPFGEGPRTCVGQRFAVAQMKVALVSIIQNFKVVLNKMTTVPYKIDPKHFLLAAEGGIKLDFYKLCENENCNKN